MSIKAKLWAESILLQLPLRFALGGVFAFAAYNKIGSTQSFANAIKGFEIVDADKYGHLIITAAYIMPWVEMIAGVLLVLGLWSRASAAAIWIMLAAFIASLIHVISDESISADCSCFGDMNLVCEATVGWCQVIRNTILLVPTSYLVWRQGGFLALDRVFRDKSGGNSPESTADQS
ncbi:MAG: DoxX family protein [Phycisphaerales bacterium]|nr:DoxX family protein [Phycisphaerales bacterium]